MHCNWIDSILLWITHLSEESLHWVNILWASNMDVFHAFVFVYTASSVSDDISKFLFLGLSFIPVSSNEFLVW